MKFVFLLKLHNLVFIFLILCSFGCTSMVHENRDESVNTKTVFKINKSLLSIQDDMKKNNITLNEASNKLRIKKSNGKVLLDIGFSELNDSVIALVRKSGVTPIVISIKYKRMSASFSNMNELLRLAEIPDVTIINPVFGMKPH